MPLPEKVERPQRVNRDYRLKVFSIAAEKVVFFRRAVPKLKRVGKALKTPEVGAFPGFFVSSGIYLPERIKKPGEGGVRPWSGPYPRVRKKPGNFI